ncbi:YolD-like family protein [Salisediminibacterium halotolerans]|uniref:YolD-like family protein n=1 Tax=Salisediminibacterium halotolerans TaxID=517425 RepID=UPI000EB40687|nr:YolD-like family protein [Salisediminibacterium halotolerans]RLJ72314.1 YolD-like protein [Actinophytocola xinjiangensis]RPE85528.1 YolD-like protein [Salisediminibacterium halotolerans]TWG33483.1 YolD-like protein [Salisediminibacterium halotolerans]GEL07934.1 hypothetical protein SHA02_13500 [Salisediminibacterium halotolerans]
MKPNKLTPNTNLRWESSRMILPEWRQKWLERQAEHVKEAPPMLDEQLFAEYGEHLQQSLATGNPVEITYWDSGHFYTFSGAVTAITKQQKTIRLASANDRLDIPLEHIKAVTRPGSSEV